jgi:hypothetical protein
MALRARAEKMEVLPDVGRIGVMKTALATHGSTSNSFIQKHSPLITGILRGFDRLRIRGTLRQLYYPKVMEAYLQAKKVLLKDFKGFAVALTDRVKSTALALSEKARRPYLYLASSQTRKETLARDIARRDGVQEGLIAVLSCVEMCKTYFVRGNKETKKLELRLDWGKCQHLYFYYIHPAFGFMHVRLQTWFPFQVQICLNGREWLSRQMDRHQMEYSRKENCFTSIPHVKGAQRLMDKQLKTDWTSELTRLLKQTHGLYQEICRPLGLEYYWTAEQSEYATDLIFKDTQTLQRIYPNLVHHAIIHFGSRDVMRFLQYGLMRNGKIQPRFQGEVISDYEERPEGIRVKHSVDGNSIKIYDKQGSVLRIETTINNPRNFRVFRATENNPNEKKQWRILRRTLADLFRRAEVSSAANERYLEALSAVNETLPLFKPAEEVCKAVLRDGERFRALNPWSQEDGNLLEAVSRGEFTLNGFRNRDIRRLLFTSKASEQEQKRRVANVTRRLRLLRGHGLIRKITGTHRYVLTAKGRSTITALLTARRANVEQLTKMAA